LIRLGLLVGVAEQTHLWWSPKHPDQAALWGSVVTLSPGFFFAVTERPVPVDFRALKALRSPLALDIYCSHRKRSQVHTSP
jgi:hypothetical protein